MTFVSITPLKTENENHYLFVSIPSENVHIIQDMALPFGLNHIWSDIRVSFWSGG